MVLTALLSACQPKNAIEKTENDVPQGSPVPAVRLTSLYADKLQCPVLPNPPQQHLLSYPPEVSRPALQSMLFKVCLKLDDRADTIQLSETSQKIWQDFQCRVGYSPTGHHNTPAFQAISISHRYAQGSLKAQAIVQKFSEHLPNSEKVVELAEQKDLHEDCDVAVAIVPRVNSDMLNEQWHICYPETGLNLWCSESMACSCHQHLPEKQQDIFHSIQQIY